MCVLCTHICKHLPVVETETVTLNNQPRGNRLVLPSYFDGAVDEIALYEEALPDDVIYAHWQRSIQGHKPYIFSPPPAPAPAPAPTPIHGVYRPIDYAPGTVLPTTGINTQGVNISALDQLSSYPAPRYSDIHATQATPALLPLGWSVVPGYATIPLACYPCLSSSK